SQAGWAATAGLQGVQARQCLAIDGSHAVVLRFTAPADGLLSIEVQERGISTVSTLNDSTATAASSPIDRLGTVVLAKQVRRAEAAKVDVRVDDTRDITGEICISADLIAPADSARSQAELNFSAGARATRSTDWTTAFS